MLVSSVDDLANASLDDLVEFLDKPLLFPLSDEEEEWSPCGEHIGGVVVGDNHEVEDKRPQIGDNLEGEDIEFENKDSDIESEGEDLNKNMA